jgi:threonylcarbamoyladenosine tRNA methylthiotransferase MtaB
VLRQIDTFVDQGYREIVLCGVDLGSYSDLSDDKQQEITSLTRLLQEVAVLPGDFRVRLSSIDPVHIDDLLLSTLAQSNRFCPYLHVSLQSGSTLILKRMKRRYDAVFLMERLEAARERIGSLVLGADVMAGFPTETESDFRCTLEILKKANIVYPHVFAYSARPGTPAARIPRQVPRDERRRRAAELRQVGQHLRAEALAGMILNTGHLLVERAPEPSGPATYHGRLENYMPVRLRGPIPPVGAILEVMVTGVDGDVLIAEALSAD